MIKQHFLSILLITTLSMAAKPATQMYEKPATSLKTALFTVGAGAATGTATVFGLSWLCNYFRITDIPLFLGVGTQANLGPVHLNIGAGTACNAAPKYVIGLCGFTLGSLAAWLVYRSQPEGKFGRAQSVLVSAQLNETLNELLQAEHDLFYRIDEKYIYNTYPRVAAYNDFVNFHKKLTDARKLLKEAMHATEDTDFIYAAKECISVFDLYIDRIVDCIAIIRSQPDWTEQLKGYDTFLARQAQERAALAAQHMALNGAFIHYR